MQTPKIKVGQTSKAPGHAKRAKRAKRSTGVLEEGMDAVVIFGEQKKTRSNENLEV